MQLSPMRRWTALVFFLAFAAGAATIVTVTASSAPAGAQIGRQRLQAELDTARSQWIAYGPRTYEVGELIACYEGCDYRGASWTRVNDGLKQYSFDTETAGVAPGYVIDEIFDRIQLGIDSDWDVVNVTGFDRANGVPGIVDFDPDSAVFGESGEGRIQVVSLIDRTEDVPGALTPTEFTTAVSCLAGRGRVDVNIVNVTAAPARYRIEFSGLTGREYTLEPNGIWRVPFTGRPDGSAAITVRRDGRVVGTETAAVACGDSPQSSASPEVQIINGCRSTRPVGGEIRFQFVNATPRARSYVIRFTSRPNRSTTAGRYGQAIRSVNGLADGRYMATITSGNETVDQVMVSVACGK